MGQPSWFCELLRCVDFLWFLVFFLVVLRWFLVVCFAFLVIFYFCFVFCFLGPLRDYFFLGFWKANPRLGNF